uniref:Uncharacterized protein n=1 Tax=Anguilla anguilla TaxID=7936 RepID=A0A0E9T2Q6_ANGAN
MINRMDKQLTWMSDVWSVIMTTISLQK